jgi:hypothetical protein
MLNRPMSRRSLLRGSLAMGAGAVALGALGTSGGRFVLMNIPSVGAASLDSDLDILNYALTLEYLEADAYKAINDAGMLSGRAATYFKAFGAHEQEHVAAITKTIQALGGTPVAKPAFDFSGVPTDPAEVVKFFQQVESVGASAYHGAAPSVKNPDVLAAALSIHANEAQHAAALADLVAPGTSLFSPAAFATPRTPDEVLKIVGPWIPSSGGNMPGAPATGGGGMANRRHHGGAELDVR